MFFGFYASENLVMFYKGKHFYKRCHSEGSEATVEVSSDLHKGQGLRRLPRRSVTAPRNDDFYKVFACT